MSQELSTSLSTLSTIWPATYDATIQNFVQVLFNQDPNGAGLGWVQDVFAGERPENLPGIANFDSMVDDDDVVAGDLVFAPSP